MITLIVKYTNYVQKGQLRPFEAQQLSKTLEGFFRTLASLRALKTLNFMKLAISFDQSNHIGPEICLGQT